MRRCHVRCKRPKASRKASQVSAK